MRLLMPLAALLLLLSPAADAGFMEGQMDLTGTWEGLIDVPGIDISMDIILVLTEKGGAVSGHMTDDWGFLDCDISGASLRDDILTFNALVAAPRDEHQMAFRMKVAGDRMTGQWESRGTYGDWTLARISDGANKTGKAFDKKDIFGVWTGPAAYKTSPGSKNVLTLKLEEKEGTLVGTFSDQFNTDYRPVNIKSFRDGRLVLEIPFVGPNDLMILEIDATVKDASHLRGKFRIEKMGRTGVWTAEKQPTK